MKKWLALSAFIICTIIFLGWAIIRIVSAINFDIECGGYLERAANSNSIELAKENLDKAITYIEAKNLTSGQVSIFLRQPKNDVGYWYKNLKSAQEQLQNTKDNTMELEKTNILMKLRETLTDHGKEGTNVTCPNGISVYPNNVILFWTAILSFIFGLIALCRIIYE